MSYVPMLHPHYNLPERNSPVKVRQGSLQELHLGVSVQVVVGSAALPGCDWSPPLVRLSIPAR